VNERASISVIIPAHNEQALIAGTVNAVLRSAGVLLSNGHGTVHLAKSGIECIVVNDGSVDRTREVLKPYIEQHGVICLDGKFGNAPRTRNAGARAAQGRILVFVDADTLIPPELLERIWRVHTAALCAGIVRYASRESGWKAACWWTFWNYVRRLPLGRAKAMPGCMFCTREAFDAYGPFDEAVEIAEEWPILSRAYRQRRFVYDWHMVARSSSRRMELRRFGYVRTFLKYCYAILFPEGRVRFPNTVRHHAE
jgi:glycosyltransferase involved in cell wall biosynthesis